MREFKFKIYDRVKIEKVKGDRHNVHAGKTGVVSAVYDPDLTPSNYPKCEYRIFINGTTTYCVESDLTPIKIIQSFCFKKGQEYHWFSDNKKRPGYVRVSGMDHEFEVE